MSNEEWYYAEDGEQLGPTTSVEIRRLVAAKKIQADDLVWREGMDDWLPAGEIPGLLVAKKKPKPAVVKPKAEWYYAEDGEQLGPITEAELRLKAEQQKIQPDDLIWREGMNDWLPAAQVSLVQLFPKKPKPARKRVPDAESSKSAEPAARNNPKSARRPSEAASPVDEEAEDSSRSLEPEPRVKSPPPAADVDLPDERHSAEDFEDDEAWEQSEAYLQQKEEELFGETSAPAMRSRRRSSWPAEPPIEQPPTTEIIREVIKEKSVPLSSDAQLSNGALLFQLLCWALCGIGVIGGVVYCVLKVNLASESKLTVALYGTAAIYILCHSVQRCLELSSQTRRRR